MTLACVNWSAGRGNFPVIRDWNLHVDVGEVVAVVGPNGIGKTTLLESIIGAARVFSGSLTIDGETVPLRSTPSDRAKRGVIYVPEGRGIFARLSVFENLALGVRRRSSLADIRAAAEPVLAEWPILKPLLDRPAGSLSGGEAQALAIARGIMSDPRYLLLDEPTLGLAPIVVSELKTAIRRIAQHAAVIIAEQNLAFCMAVSDRVLVASPDGSLYSATKADTDAAIRQYMGEESGDPATN